SPPTALPSIHALGEPTPSSLNFTGPPLAVWKRAAAKRGSRFSPNSAFNSSFGRAPRTVLYITSQVLISLLRISGSFVPVLLLLMRHARATVDLEASKGPGFPSS